MKEVSGLSGRLLTVREVARVLSVSQTHVRRLMSSGQMGTVWVSRRCPRVSEADLGVFLRERRERLQDLTEPRDDGEVGRGQVR